MPNVANLQVKVTKKGVTETTRELNKLSTASGTAEKKAGTLNKAFSSLTSQALALAAAYVSVEGALGAIRVTDELIGLETRLKAATAATGDFNEVYSQLVESSNKVGVELAGNVALFQNLARVLPETGATNDEILRMIESISKLGIISGVSATDLKFAMRQFSQAMAAGVVRAEEFNSIVENTPELAFRIATGMDTTLGKLRLAVLEGKVLSEDVFRSILSQTDQIDKDFEKVPRRIGMATSEMKNTFQQLMGEINSVTGATSHLVGIINDATAMTIVMKDSFRAIKGFASDFYDAVRYLAMGAAGWNFDFDTAEITYDFEAVGETIYNEFIKPWDEVQDQIDLTRSKIQIINQMIRDYKEFDTTPLIDVDAELEKANVVDTAYQRVIDRIELRGKSEEETIAILLERSKKKFAQMDKLGLDQESVKLRNRLYAEAIDLQYKAEDMQAALDEDKLASRLKLIGLMQNEKDAEFESLTNKEKLVVLEGERKSIAEEIASTKYEEEGSVERLIELYERKNAVEAGISGVKSDRQSKIDALRNELTEENETAYSLYQERMDRLEKLRQEEGISEEAYHATSLEIFKAYEQAKTDELQTQAEIRRQINEDFTLGSLEVAQQAAELASDAAEEGSNTQKAMFALAKGIAFATAMVNANLAYTRTLGTDPEPTEARIAKAELVRGLGYASAGLIAAQTIVGLKEHGGLIPSGKSAIVGEAGPEFVRGPAYVTSARTTAGMMSSSGGTSNTGKTFINVRNEAGQLVSANAKSSRTSDGEIVDVTIRELIRRIDKGGNIESKTFDKNYRSVRGRS